ncbi:hypothetical protein D3C78_894490 [compost metagenome]
MNVIACQRLGNIAASHRDKVNDQLAAIRIRPELTTQLIARIIQYFARCFRIIRNTRIGGIMILRVRWRNERRRIPSEAMVEALADLIIIDRMPHRFPQIHVAHFGIRIGSDLLRLRVPFPQLKADIRVGAINDAKKLHIGHIRIIRVLINREGIYKVDSTAFQLLNDRCRINDLKHYLVERRLSPPIICVFLIYDRFARHDADNLEGTKANWLLAHLRGGRHLGNLHISENMLRQRVRPYAPC